MSTEELLDFFSPPSEPKNPFDDDIEESTKIQGKVDITKLDTIIKKGETLRIRPVTTYIESFYGMYQSDGNVWYEGKILTLMEFLKETREKSRRSAVCPQTRSTTNPLKYIEVYMNGEWNFILKILDPKASVPSYTYAYNLFYDDFKCLLGKNMFKFLTLAPNSYRAKCFTSLPRKWIEEYENRIQTLYTKSEPVSNDPVITQEYVNMKWNEVLETKNQTVKESCVIGHETRVITNSPSIVTTESVTVLPTCEMCHGQGLYLIGADSLCSYCRDKKSLAIASLPIIKDMALGPRRAIPKKIRGEAWKIQFGESTKGFCFCCKKGLDIFDSWHAGHIVSHVNGGSDTAVNLRPVCASCNLSMGTENMDVFKARYYPN